MLCINVGDLCAAGSPSDVGKLCGFPRPRRPIVYYTDEIRILEMLL